MRYFLFDIFSNIKGYPTQALEASSEGEAWEKASQLAGGRENIRSLRECSKAQYESLALSW